MTAAANPAHLTQKNCSKCATAFHCGAGSGTGCWCDELPALVPAPERDCLCLACLRDAIALQRWQPQG
jgi:hypothetical protein